MLRTCTICLAFVLFTIHLSAQTRRLTYRESFADFPNPERGFYLPIQTSTTKFVPLDSAVLASYRKQPQRTAKANYSVFCTLVYGRIGWRRSKTGR